ncbi:multicopper oxidase domain-containing protein [Streptomyces antibioticus]
MTASRLRTADDVRLASATTDVTHPIEPTGGTEKYNRAINGRPFDVADPQANPILVQAGSVCGLDFVNGTDMWHPMHLHGRTCRLGSSGPRGDTAIVPPRTKTSVFFDADNPGRWMLRCHNACAAKPG